MYINAKVIVASTKDNYDNNDKHYPLIIKLNYNNYVKSNCSN